MTSTLVVGAALSAQAQSSVCVEFADGGVGCDDEGEANDDTKRNQFWRNLLQASQTLGDGVSAMLLLRHRTHDPSRRLHAHKALLHIDDAGRLRAQHHARPHCTC